jgi:hypothetical protein
MKSCRNYIKGIEHCIRTDSIKGLRHRCDVKTVSCIGGIVPVKQGADRLYPDLIYDR